MAWVSLNNLTRFYTKLKEKFYLKTEIDTKVSKLNNKINNKTRINYLRPTLQTTTQGGVTCTNNGDGTYAANGTNTSSWNAFTLNSLKCDTNKTIRLTGGNGNVSVVIWDTKNETIKADSNGSKPNVTVTLDADISYDVAILIREKTTLDNIVVKPMLTDDLSATYDDFVSGFDCLTPDIKMDLLWTNASPKSAFANQTIILDLSKYNFIYVTFYRITTDDTLMYYLLPKNTIEICPSTDYDNNIRGMMRPVRFTNTYVAFDSCYVLSNVNNNYMIPYQIYGVR